MLDDPQSWQSTSLPPLKNTYANESNCKTACLLTEILNSIQLTMPISATTYTPDPSLKELEDSVTTQHAAKWKVIGTLLGLPSGKLNAIESEWPTNAERCCNSMLEAWLDVDTTASWEKLRGAIESPAVSGTQGSVSQGE